MRTATSILSLRFVTVVSLLAGSFLAGSFLAGPAVASETERLVGTLHAVWGDSAPGLEWEGHQAYFLVDDQGESTEISISPEMLRAAGGLHLWNGRRVEATLGGEVKAEIYGTRTGRRVMAVNLLPTLDLPSSDLPGTGKPGELATKSGELTTKAVTGSQPWVSILCKFSDVGDEPKDLAFFQDMYANAPGGLDHYWREQSYNTINIIGSTAVNWVTLPHPQTYYIPTPGSNSNSNLNQLFNDCTQAADPFVDFSNGGNPFVGINMMFNEVLDCCAWGGGMYGTLDGISKVWRVTWEPPWGYANEGVMGHEMGHGFGLPHSNNSDADSNPYDSPWDVMSAATGYSVYDATYGALGKHTISFHKDLLGWIPAGEKLVVSDPGVYTATVDFLNNASTTNYRMAEVTIPGGSTFYTVEARQQSGDYDGNLPGTTVIINHIDRSRTEDAWTVDAANPPSGYGDTEGVMWRVGETFVDSANDIEITVLEATANGFRVEIRYLASLSSDIFANGFEAGNMLDWS